MDKLKKWDIDAHKDGTAKDGITIVPHRIITAVFVTENVSPVE